MYLRTIKRKNKDGSVVEYVQLAIEQWAADEVFLGEHEPLQVQHFYRAMDFLLEHGEAIQKEVFWSTANLLNLAVDLIFFDTTNTYFEIDEPGPSDLKAYGKSKQKRDDLPQVTIGLAVTRGFSQNQQTRFLT